MEILNLEMVPMEETHSIPGLLKRFLQWEYNKATHKVLGSWKSSCSAGMQESAQVLEMFFSNML